jgi:hypothetical protein
MDWSNDQQIPNVGISGSPALAFCNQRLVCVHEGERNSGSLWYTHFDGDEWSDDTPISDLGTTGGPGLAVFKGRLYCAHQGYGENGELWWTTFDGNVWSADRQIPNAAISGSPALIGFFDQAGNGTLWCVYQGRGPTNLMEYAVTSDGITWSQDQEIPTAVAGSGPGVAAFKGKLYVAYQEGGEEGVGNGELWWVTFDGNGWSKQQQVPNVGISGSPALAEYQGGLLCVHEGERNSGTLWYTITYDGITWSPDQEIPNLGTSGGPGLSPYLDGKLYCAHQGYGDSGELWLTAAESL